MTYFIASIFLVIRRTEEKGSDVKLASWLLRDTFLGECDTAVIISNDSDLAEAVRIAKDDAGTKVGVLNPHPMRNRSNRFKGTFFKQIRASALARTQLPAVVYDRRGPIHKPTSW